MRNELLYFWALGDLHYHTHKLWKELQTKRFAPMFHDLHSLWQEEGPPAFCVSPGDQVETCSPEDYHLARKELTALLGPIPFYPGVGNHEYFSYTDPPEQYDQFTRCWNKPTRYSWQTGKDGAVTCIMLDYPDPHIYPALVENPSMPRESMDFLEQTLQEHPNNPVIIFSHTPLYNTVLDRDEKRNLDYHSLESQFSLTNSHEVRALFARHKNVGLYFCGHTHSGWGAPNLIYTETLGGHPFTSVNLMSPWYTGRNHSPRVSEDGLHITTPVDDPDMLISFAVRIYQGEASIRARDHRAREWLKEWFVPL